MPDSTINGLTSVLGTNVDQTADQFPIWVNSASTTRKISRTELFNGPAVGGIGSAIRAAASDYAAVAFDGATLGTRITSTLTGQNIGTGDFSLWSRFRVPALAAFATNPAVISLGQSATDGSGVSTFRIVLLSGGNLSIRSNDGSGASTNSDVSGFSAAYSGQVVDIVVTRTGSTVKLYINGTDTAITGNLNGSNSITSTYCHVGIGTQNTTSFTGRIYRSVVFNRALSASDVTELITTGVNPADQWGTQTAAYTSDFSAGADGWSGVRGTSTGNIDGISGVDNTLRFTVDGTASNTHYEANIAVPGLLVSKRYRVGFNYFITAANATMNGLRLAQFTTSNFLTPVQSVTGAWTSTTPVEFVATETRLDVLGYAGAVNIFNGNGTDTFYLHSIVLTRIGAIVDLDFTVGAGYQATDRSTNALHGTLFNGVEFTVPRRVAVLYATTSFNGDTLVLGSNLSIPTNAIIEDIICNSSGTATVSIGTAPAGTTIVNAASVVAGRQKLTIGTPFSSNGTLYVKSNSAAVLQFTILYTIAA